MEELKHCINCDCQDFTTLYSLKDYFFTQENFTIQQCNRCGLRFTNPRPEEKDLGAYYKTENYLSHSDRNKTLFDKMYHFIKKYNLDHKRKLIEKFHTSGTIIDIGCGTGAFLGQFDKKRWSRIGFEPDADAREIAKNSYGIEARDLQAMNNLNGTKAEVITMWHVLEHVSLINEQLIKIKSMLKQDGILVIAVPMSNSHDANYYGKYWAAYDVPRHLYHFTKDTLQQLLSKHGFNLVENYPMVFDAFYISMLSEKYKKSSLPLVQSLIKGLRFDFAAKTKKGTYSSMIFVFRQ
ncbi:MAG: class I SAM-dependent methyltransferase [Bacteroidota bacterium]|nr:class I SAM-dependent methyltransferase [Bacteroidota bacterium]